MSRPDLMLFDTAAGGHHGLFYQHLIRRWGDLGVEGELVLAMPEGFMETHDALPPLLARYPNASFQIAHMKPPEPLRSFAMRDMIRRDLAEGALLQQAIETYRPRHCLLMHFDSLQVSLARGIPGLGDTAVSGIYFRPVFRPDAGAAPIAILRTLQKTTLLRLAARNRHLNTLFCLNPLVVSKLNAQLPRIQVVALPDGVESTEATVGDPASIRRDWGIGTERKMALLFGSLAERKGLYPLLEAVTLLPATAQRQLAIVFAGAIHPGDRTRFLTQVEHARTHSEVQLVVQEAFIPETAVQASFGAADLILAPYQNHLGSSNVLVRAALAGIPILGPRQGLMGVHVATHNLGLAIDVTQPTQIATALATWLTTGNMASFDPIKARAFARANTDSAFADTILKALKIIPSRSKDA